MTRRQFVAASAMAGAAALMPAAQAQDKPMKNWKIARIETIPVVYPVVGRFKFFEGPDGKPTGRQTVVVKITADDGTVGWGQSVPVNKWSYETLESVQSTIDKYLAPVLLGHEVFDGPHIESTMDKWIAPCFSTGQPICKAGIDLALWDLRGKLTGKSIRDLWGIKGRDKITISWTLNPVKLDDVGPLIEQGRKRGYQNFNIKVAPDLKFDLELARLVKKLAPDGFLWADANGGYDEATALDAVPKLAEAGVAVLEQPTRPTRFATYAKLRKLKALPILMDEGVINTAELEEFIKLEMLDGVAMKPARVGGLTEAKRQIELLNKHKLMFLGSGLTDPDLSLAASLILYGAFDLKFPAALNGRQFLDGTVLKTSFDVVEGQMALPNGPGLGVEIDPEKLERLRVKA